MNSSKFVYEFEFDASSVEATAQRLTQIYQRSLAQVKVPMAGAGGQAESQVAVAQARAAQAQITADARAQANERSAAAKAESQIRIQQSKAVSSQVAEEEKRITAQVKSEIRERERAQRAASRGSWNGEIVPGGGIVGKIAGATIAGMGAGYIAGQVGGYTVEADALQTTYRRQSVAARELAGSQSELNALMLAYNQATGNAVDKGTALAQVTRLQAVGFADNTRELERITRGARGTSLATGSSVDYLLSQAQLAVANQSMMRLDQLAIGVSEFKSQIEELKVTMPGLTEEMRYQEAILTIWERKFGALTESAEAQATQVELLSKAWTDLKLVMPTSGPVQGAAGAGTALLEGLNVGFGGRDPEVLQRYAERRVQNRQVLQLGMAGALATQPGGSAMIELMNSLMAQQNERAQQLAQAWQLVNDAVADGVPGASAFQDRLIEIEDSFQRTGRVGSEFVPILQDVDMQLAALSVRTPSVIAGMDGVTSSVLGAASAMDELITASSQALSSGSLSAVMGMLAGGAITEEQARAMVGSNQAAIDRSADAQRGTPGLTETDIAIAQAQTNAEIMAPIEALNSTIQRIEGMATQVVEQGLMTPEEASAIATAAIAQAQTASMGWDERNLMGVGLATAQTADEKTILAPYQMALDNEEERLKGIREAEAAGKRAAREQESAAKKAAQELERAAKEMVDEFESRLGRIPGLMSPSEVTEADMELSKLGLYQEKPDEYLRQLLAETAKDPTKRTDYANVDPAEAAQAIGMDPNSDPYAIGLAFQKAWESGSLWANRENIGKFLNTDAVARELGMQRQGELGQQNLLDYLGLDPRIVSAAGYQGILPGRMMSPMDMAMMAPGMAQNYGQMPGMPALQGTEGQQGYFTAPGGAMAAGLMEGSQAELQQFGLNAVQIIATAMTGEEAQAQWNALGGAIGTMMTTAVEEAIGQTDFVGIVVAAAVAQIQDALDGQGE